MAYADLDKVAQTVNIFMGTYFGEDNVLKVIKEMYKSLSQHIADEYIDENDLPIGCGMYGMNLEYSGGEPALRLIIEVSAAYKDDE